MQFSTLLRHWLPTSDPPVRIVDAHPGLVWTPLLRNHIGDKAVRILTRTGLANLIYKSSSEGAQAIVASLDSSQLTLAAREQVSLSMASQADTHLLRAPHSMPQFSFGNMCLHLNSRGW
jgi:hypothetical protein